LVLVGHGAFLERNERIQYLERRGGQERAARTLGIVRDESIVLPIQKDKHASEILLGEQWHKALIGDPIGGSRAARREKRCEYDRLNQGASYRAEFGHGNLRWFTTHDRRRA
jgi:hypothetical protein